MKRIFLPGAIRSGTNWVAIVLNNNVTGIECRSILVEPRYDSEEKKVILDHLWHWTFPGELDHYKKLINHSQYPQDIMLGVVRNPYMWIESIVHKGWQFNTQPHPQLEKMTWEPQAWLMCGATWSMDIFHEEEYLVPGMNPNLKRNLYALVTFLKLFYEKWEEKGNMEMIVRYEDFLFPEKAIETTKKIIEKFEIEGEIKDEDNFILPRKLIPFSPNWTPPQLKYNKKQIPMRLRDDEIRYINKHLSDFIIKCGYDVIDV